MKRRGQYPPVFTYALCAVGLAVSVLLALFLPDWYSEWSDSRTFQEVVTKEREEISFVDSQEMDVSQRLQAVSQINQSSYVDSYGNGNYEEVYGLVEPEDPKRVMEQCIESLSGWTEAGLIPQSYLSMLSLALERSGDGGIEEAYGEENTSQYEMDGMMWYTYVDTLEGQIPVYVLAIGLREAGEETPDYNDSLILHLIMDADTGFLYYVSILGQEAAEHLAWELNFESAKHMVEFYMAGSGKAGESKIIMGIPDFAQAGLAQSYRAEFLDLYGLELNITLEYGDSVANAYRILECCPWGSGYTVMYGTREWTDYIYPIMGTYWWEQWTVPADEWLAVLYSMMSSEEAQSF